MTSMKYVGFVLFLGVFPLIPIWSQQSSTSVRPGSIQWYAERAKEHGDTAITVPAPRGMHEKMQTLDQALSTYQVIIGTPLTSLTQLVDPDHVYTWYKLHILETLITHPNPEVPAVSIPAALLPVASNEVIIRIQGGTLTVDGIRVTVVDEALPLLTPDTKYLLFLSPDSSGKFDYLRAGSNALFVLNADNKIAPAKPIHSRLQGDVDLSTNGVLNTLRELAKAKASERQSSK